MNARKFESPQQQSFGIYATSIPMDFEDNDGTGNVPSEWECQLTPDFHWSSELFFGQAELSSTSTEPYRVADSDDPWLRPPPRQADGDSLAACPSSRPHDIWSNTPTRSCTSGRRGPTDASFEAKASNIPPLFPRTTLHDTPQLVMRTDDSGRLIDANDELIRRIGYSRDEFLRLHLHNVDVMHTHAQIQSLLAQPDRRESHAAILRCKNGTKIPVQMSIREDEESCRRLVARELRQEDGTIESASTPRTVGFGADRPQIGNVVAAALAHELNQPLTAIANYSLLLENATVHKTHDFTVIAETSEKIAEQAMRAGDIIDRMRSLVSNAPVQAQVCNPLEMVKGALRLMADALERHQVQLAIEYREPPPDIRADCLQIEQVLINLIRNSIHAMDVVPASRRHLTIRLATCDSDWMEISVIDSGRGFSQPLTKPAFAPLPRTKKQGMGIGLKICRSIVDAHRGSIYTVPCSHGAIVAFKLPISKEFD